MTGLNRADLGRLSRTPVTSVVSPPMSIATSLTADDLRTLIRGYADALAAHRETINRLNVYPVPDGDTGTNMALTLASVVAELDGAESDLDSTCQAISHGSLMGARGNSGVILSQILRGLSAEFRAAPAIDGAAFATALDAAATAAYGAVMKPVEGTILTVVRVAAEGGRAAADAGSDLLGVLEAAHASGTDALARTPEMLQVLADAGVVDSGGTGLMLMFDVALNIVCGRPIPEAAEDPAGASAEFLDAFDAAHGDGSHDGSLASLRYEVMYFLEAPDEAVPGFKDVWSTLGDSIVVVGGDGIWNCHIHTDDIGATIDAAVDIALHDGGADWAPSATLGNGWAWCDPSTTQNPEGLNYNMTQAVGPLAPIARLPGGSLGYMMPRWSQACDSRFYCGVREEARGARGGARTLGVLAVRGGAWLVRWGARAARRNFLR